jgi:hypothetical protein
VGPSSWPAAMPDLGARTDFRMNLGDHLAFDPNIPIVSVFGPGKPEPERS